MCGASECCRKSRGKLNEFDFGLESGTDFVSRPPTTTRALYMSLVNPSSSQSICRSGATVNETERQGDRNKKKKIEKKDKETINKTNSSCPPR